MSDEPEDRNFVRGAAVDSVVAGELVLGVILNCAFAIAITGVRSKQFEEKSDGSR